MIAAFNLLPYSHQYKIVSTYDMSVLLKCKGNSRRPIHHRDHNNADAAISL